MGHENGAALQLGELGIVAAGTLYVLSAVRSSQHCTLHSCIMVLLSRWYKTFLDYHRNSVNRPRILPCCLAAAVRAAGTHENNTAGSFPFRACQQITWPLELRFGGNQQTFFITFSIQRL